MKYEKLILENKEYDKLLKLLAMVQLRKDETYMSSVRKLLSELKSAARVPANQLPEDIVRFNSTVSVLFQNGQGRTLQIVSPEHGDVTRNKISVLAPMSLALFGYSEGDEVIWEFPSGVQVIKILKVEQMVSELKPIEP